MTVDGRPETKLMAVFNHEPGGEVEFGKYWFGPGDSPPIGNLEMLEMAVAAYRVIDPDYQNYYNEDREFVIRVEGCDDYVVSTDSGTWQELGVYYRGKPQVDGKWVSAKATAFAISRVNCIRFIWEYMPGFKTPHTYHAVIHWLKIHIDTTKYIYVQITDDETKIGNPLYLYAPAAYQKMRGGIGSVGSAGAPRSLPYDIGAASEGAAISLARTKLLTHLRNHQMRRYEYSGPLPVKPELGLSIGVDEDADGSDDYIGEIWEYAVTVGADGIIATAAVKDSTADTIA